MRLFFFYLIFVESARQNLSSRDKLTVKYNDVSYGPSSTVEVNLESDEKDFEIIIPRLSGPINVRNSSPGTHSHPDGSFRIPKDSEEKNVKFSVYCLEEDEKIKIAAAKIKSGSDEIQIKITKECDKNNSSLIVCTIAICLALFSIIIAILTVCIYITYTKKNNNNQGNNNREDELLLEQPAAGIRTFNRKNLELLKTVNEGNLGVIYQGKLTLSRKQKIDVMIKSITRSNNMNEKQSMLTDEEMLRDSSQFYGVKHENICSLIGHIVDNGEPLAIFPWAEMGNLKMFLRRCQLRSPKSGPSSKSYISTIDLISIGQSAAEALYFLEQSKIIHGDIAARNCALGAKNKFYLCDRALSQDLFSSDYEVVGNFLLPVRWSPPEALDCPSQTSLKGDIWSFGIFLWELISLAKTPYSDIDAEQINKYLQDGYRAAKPPGCTKELYDLMTICWEYNPENRPQTTYILQVMERAKQFQTNIF